MLKSELIQVLASKLLDLNTHDVELAVNSMIEQIAEALAIPNSVSRQTDGECRRIILIRDFKVYCSMLRFSQ